MNNEPSYIIINLDGVRINIRLRSGATLFPLVPKITGSWRLADSTSPIMKKLLVECLLNRKVTTQISQRSKRLLSNTLILLKSQTSEEFQQTTRWLEHSSKWKAPEFRLFYYICVVVKVRMSQWTLDRGGWCLIVLKKVLPDRLYNHFLLFHAACRLLCSSHWHTITSRNVVFSRFFLLAAPLYGKQSKIFYMHSLIHLADDAKNMNCPLMYLTAFPFKNLLGQLKKWFAVRTNLWNRYAVDYTKGLTWTFKNFYRLSIC